MKVELIRSGKKIAGPIEWDQTAIRNIISAHGGNDALVPANFSNSMTISTIDIKRVVEDKPSITNVERHVMGSREETASEVIYHYTVAPMTVSGKQSQLRSALSAMHDAYEAGTVIHRDVAIKVDLEARIAIKDVMDQFNAAAITSIVWRGKVPSTDIDIDILTGGDSGQNARIAIASTLEMTALYEAVKGYLNKGFIARSAVEDLINSGTLAELGALSLRKEWNAIVTA